MSCSGSRMGSRCVSSQRSPERTRWRSRNPYPHRNERPQEPIALRCSMEDRKWIAPRRRDPGSATTGNLGGLLMSSHLLQYLRMDLRRAIVGIVMTAALVALSTPALAGGSAVVRLDEPPGDVLVATPWQFGFMVLQHDVSPNSDVTPVVRALHKETGEEVTATGRQEGAVGHFVAEVTFPRAGEWKWSIEPLPYAETSFETLTVLESPSALSYPSQIVTGSCGDISRTTNEAADVVLGLQAQNAENIGLAVLHDEGERTAVTLYLLNPDLIRETTAATLAAPEEALTVEIVDAWAFQPHSLEVAPGATVTWVNNSDVAHTVTGADLSFDDSGLIEPGDSFRQTFDEPGTYHYKCGHHPDMTGVIVVS